MHISKTTALVLTALTLLAATLPLQASRFSQLDGNPGLRSASAMVISDDGSVIYGKDEDTVRPIASITKLMTAMVILDSGVDMQEKITVTGGCSSRAIPSRQTRQIETVPSAAHPNGQLTSALRCIFV